MYPARFDYVVPDSLPEAVSTLEATARELGPGNARVLAGGQSLMRALRFRFESPGLLVDLRRLGLSGIYAKDGVLSVGAMTTDAHIEATAVVRDQFPLLSDVARVIADPLVRNLGTIGGSAAFAHPSGDWGPALLASRAVLVATGPRGERRVPADEFFVGSYCTALGDADILTRIEVNGPGAGGAYLKMHRKVGDYATVGVGVQVDIDADGAISSCGIGMSGVALSYVRAAKAEEYLLGRHLDRDALRRASGIASEETHPVKDARGSADYKREMVKVLCERAIVRAAARLGVPVES